MSRLVHLNGPPGIGKSSLARRYVRDRALSFCLDIDAVRREIGQWQAHEERSGLLARDMALQMAATHLAAGFDVVVPQYAVRASFVGQLADASDRAGAAFHEVFLVAPREMAVERFLRRRDDPQWAVHHAEAEAAIGGMDQLLRMIDRLEEFRAERTSAVVLPADADLEHVYEELVRALDAGQSTQGTG